MVVSLSLQKPFIRKRKSVSQIFEAELSPCSKCDDPMTQYEPRYVLYLIDMSRYEYEIWVQIKVKVSAKITLGQGRGQRQNKVKVKDQIRELEV